MGVVLTFVMKRKRQVALLILALYITLTAHNVAAESWSDRIGNAIQSIFDTIAGGIKTVISSLFDALTWPFRQFQYGMASVWHWSYEKLGPLGIVVTIGIGGLVIYEIIFWVERYIEQITNN